MPFASSSRLAVALIKEITPGVPPNTGNATALRVTGESLKFDLQTEASKEIRADRMTADLIVTDAKTGGGLTIEWSFKEYDELLGALLQNPWGAAIDTAVSATFTSGANPTLTAATGNPFANLVAGQWVKVSGATNASNNGLFRIKARTPLMLTFDPNSAIVNETNTTGVKVQSQRLSNGVTQSSFTLEKVLTDVGQYFCYRGMTPSKLSLSLQTGNIVTGSMEFMGLGMTLKNATSLPGTVQPSQTGTPMNAVKGVGNISEGGTVLNGTAFKSLSLDIDNSLRGQSAIGTLGYIGVASGTLKVSGKVDAYFADGTLYNKLLNNTDSALAFTITDGNNNGYAITLPRVKYTSGEVNAGAINTDIMVSMGWQAQIDPVTGSMILVDKLGV